MYLSLFISVSDGDLLDFHVVLHCLKTSRSSERRFSAVLAAPDFLAGYVVTPGSLQFPQATF
jgi:hypothetical protein